MDYMIYIYAALAFIIAGGSGFICWHAGHRIGKREGRRETDAKMFRLGEAHGYANAGHVAYEDKTRSRLSDAIDRHLERMDSDD